MACLRERMIHRVAERRLNQSRPPIQPSLRDVTYPPSKQALYARHTKMWIRDACPFSTASGSERVFPERSVAGAPLAPARGTDHIIHIIQYREQ
jgi:hypothetical protein